MLAYSTSIILDFDDLEQMTTACIAARYVFKGYLLLDIYSIINFVVKISQKLRYIILTGVVTGVEANHDILENIHPFFVLLAKAAFGPIYLCNLI